MLRKLVVEAIGTFFLVFTVGQVSLDPGSAGALGPWAVAAVLMAMVYSGGHVSGAHYNPAVSLAFFIRRKATVHEMVGYWVVQLVAAGLAAVTVLAIKGGGPLNVPTMNVGKALAAEAIFTFALAHVVLNVGTVKVAEGNSYYGLGIAATVLAGAYAVGSVSGAHFNPAVTVGELVMGMIGPAEAILFLLAQLAAGALAAVVFRALDLASEASDRIAVPE